MCFSTEVPKKRRFPFKNALPFPLPPNRMSQWKSEEIAGSFQHCMLFYMAYPNRLLISYNMCKTLQLTGDQNTKLRTHNTSSSKTALATSQTTNYLKNTTSYLQSTEWHGAKVYSRSSSALHSDEAISIFFKKFACNTEVEPQVLLMETDLSSCCAQALELPPRWH